MNNYELKESIGYLTNKIHSIFKVLINREFKSKGYDLTVEHWSLLAIAYNNPGSTQSDLSILSMRDKTNVTRIIDFLEKRGLVTRKKNDKDRRLFQIKVLPKGKVLVKELVSLVVEMNLIAESDISKEKLLITQEVLQRILKNLKNNI